MPQRKAGFHQAVCSLLLVELAHCSVYLSFSFVPLLCSACLQCPGNTLRTVKWSTYVGTSALDPL